MLAPRESSAAFFTIFHVGIVRLLENHHSIVAVGLSRRTAFSKHRLRFGVFEAHLVVCLVSVRTVRLLLEKSRLS